MHSNLKDAAPFIRSNLIKPENIINMKCDLCFCDEFPNCIIPDEKLDDGTNNPLVYFGIYTYQGIFSNYGIIPNGPYLWKLCD